LVEAPQVPQLSTKSGLENINSFDEETRTSQKKTACSFLATRDRFGVTTRAFTKKRCIFL
jgi:hypothetical protein